LLFSLGSVDSLLACDRTVLFDGVLTMIQNTPPAQLTARDFMTQRLVTLRPEMDVIQAVQLLL
jgi:sulfur relay (sulfurtransferase) DsrF/TusC family protein